MKLTPASTKRLALLGLLLCLAAPLAGIEREPLEVYRARRDALGVAVDGFVVVFAELVNDLIEY